jgi:hypothetical protein
MDCKKVQRAISELNEFDFQFLPSVLRKHISVCSSCADELKWAETVYRHLKSFRLPDPNPEFWEQMSKNIQVELMINGIEGSRKNWWLWRTPAWAKFPALASGLAAATAAVVIAFWGISPHHWPGLRSASTPRTEATAPTVPQSCLNIVNAKIGSGTALDTATKEELHACVRSLVSRGLQTREIAGWAGDPIILAGTDVSVDNNLGYLGPGELERLSHLLNQKYPR